MNEYCGKCSKIFNMNCLLKRLSSFAILSLGKRELVAFWCHVTVSILGLFLTVPCIGLQCVIVAFPGHTHFLQTAHT